MLAISTRARSVESDGVSVHLDETILFFGNFGKVEGGRDKKSLSLNKSVKWKRKK